MMALSEYKLQIHITLYDAVKKQYTLYKENKDHKFHQSLYFALQKKAEELIEHATRMNKEILKEHNIRCLSYRDSFIKLSEVGFDKKLIEKMSSLAWLRNRLAHEYLDITEEETIKEIEYLLECYPEYLKAIESGLKQ